MLGFRFANALFRGFGWTFILYFGRRIITFLATIILARLIGPEAFGLMAAALLMINYLDAFSDAGAGLALVQSREEPEKIIRPAFTVSLGMGLLLTVLFFLAAPAMASYFKQPDLTPILMVLSPMFLLSSFSSVQDGWLKRHFRFSARVAPQIIRATAKAISSIILALFGYGVWSLVWGQLFGQFVGAIAYLRASRRWPAFSLDWARAFMLSSFGLQMSFITLLGVLGDTLDKLIIGRMFDSSALGIYTIGAILPEMIVLGICLTTSQVVFAAFSRAQGRPRLLRSGLQLTLRYVNFLTFGAAAGIALVAHDFISTVYTEDWSGAIPLMQILAVSAALKAITHNIGDVFKAVGRPMVLIMLLFASLAISAPLLITGAQFGLNGIALSRLVASALTVALTLVVAQRVFGLTWQGLANSLKSPLLATAAMIVACETAKFLLEDTSPFSRMIVTILVGAVVYPVVIYLTEPDMVRTALSRRKKKG